MLKPLLPNLPFGLDAVRAHLAGTRSGLWRFQAAVDSRSLYELFWEAAAVALVALACVAATRRRAWQDRARIAWLGVAPVVAFATVLAVDYLGAAGRSGVTGRHLIGTVPLLAIAMATGADVLGCRWISVLLTGVVAASLALEVGSVTRYFQRTYGGLVEAPHDAPRVAETLVETEHRGAYLTVTPPCAATRLRLRLTPPPTLLATTQGTMRLVGTRPNGWAVYALDATSAQPLSVVLPPDVRVGGRRHAATSAARWNGPGGPAVVVYCEDPNGKGRAYRAQFQPLHPAGLAQSIDGISRWWALAWAAVGATGFVAAGLEAANSRPRRV